MYIDEETKQSAEKLFNDNIKMTQHFAKKFYPFMKFGVYEYDDLIQTANLSLWKACLTFDQSKGHKFFTYASRCIMNDLIMFKNKSFKEDREDYISYNSEVQQDEETTFIDLFFTDFDPKLDDVTSSLFLEDLENKVKSYFLFEQKEKYLSIIENMLKSYSIKELIEIFDYDRKDVKFCFEIVKYLINKESIEDDVLIVKVNIYNNFKDYVIKARRLLKEHEGTKENPNDILKYYSPAELAYNILKNNGYSLLVNEIKSKGGKIK